MAPVVVHLLPAARRRRAVGPFPHRSVAAHGAPIVVRRGAAAADVLVPCSDVSFTAQLRPAIIDGRTAAAGVAAEIPCSQLASAAHVFVAVEYRTAAAVSSVAVPLWLDNPPRTTDLTLRVVLAAGATG